jgi:hypothetical protein
VEAIIHSSYAERWQILPLSGGFVEPTLSPFNSTQYTGKVLVHNADIVICLDAPPQAVSLTSGPLRVNAMAPFPSSSKT